AGRVDPGRVLMGAAAVSTAALVGLAAAHSTLAAAIALAVLGMFSSMLHPLAKARAYATLPGRPALVNAVAAAMIPLDIAAPIGLGLVATHAGPSIAVALLLVAPLGILAVAIRYRA